METNLYEKVINVGMDALDQISDPYSRAMAAAALAGTMHPMDSNSISETSTEPAPAKRTRRSKEEKPVEPAQEITAEKPATEEEQLVQAADAEMAVPAENAAPSSEGGTWDAASLEKYKEQLAVLEAARVGHGEANMIAWIEDFSSGQLHSFEEIVPANIDAFYTYLVQPN